MAKAVTESAVSTTSTGRALGLVKKPTAATTAPGSARSRPADPGALVAAVGFFTDPDALPVEVVLTALSVTAFATLDAYWLTARNNHRLQNRAGRCEECGEQLDPSLEFCYWCTTPRDDERSA